jgi:hypothetical protein
MAAPSAGMKLGLRLSLLKCDQFMVDIGFAHRN